MTKTTKSNRGRRPVSAFFALNSVTLQGEDRSKKPMRKRKMAMVANQVRMEEEDLRDVAFWLERPVSERIAEVTRLRKAYYSWILGVYPRHIEKAFSQRSYDS